MQKESTVYTEPTAWGNLKFAARLYRVPRAEWEARVRELTTARSRPSTTRSDSRARFSAYSR